MSKPVVKEAKEEKKEKEILGSRVLPKFIMFDGEGPYARKHVSNCCCVNGRPSEPR
jgi:hypothetical protein